MQKADRQGLPSWPIANSMRAEGFRPKAYLPGLAGAEAGFTSSSTDRACCPRTYMMVSVNEVSMKMIDDQVVSRVRTLAAARGPNAVCEPWPPKAPARSAERPC